MLVYNMRESNILKILADLQEASTSPISNGRLFFQASVPFLLGNASLRTCWRILARGKKEFRIRWAIVPREGMLFQSRRNPANTDQDYTTSKMAKDWRRNSRRNASYRGWNLSVLKQEKRIFVSARRKTIDRDASIASNFIRVHRSPNEICRFLRRNATCIELLGVTCICSRFFRLVLVCRWEFLRRLRRTNRVSRIIRKLESNRKLRTRSLVSSIFHDL